MYTGNDDAKKSGNSLVKKWKKKKSNSELTIQVKQIIPQ